MGDLALDTEVRQLDDETYAVTLNQDWEIWGPQGGYVAACALRATGAASAHPLPVAMSCHYLNVAQWGEVQLRVAPRRQGREVGAYRVEMSQGDRPILDAMVWTAAAGDGLDYDDTEMPRVAQPDALRSMAEGAPTWPPFPFWNNLTYKIEDIQEWPPPDAGGQAIWRAWLRFASSLDTTDVWVDAARSVILIDVASWPAVQTRYNGQAGGFVAPTLDLNVAFHQPASGHEWLLCDAAAPISTAGLFGWNARVWSEGGALHASGGGQCRYRRLPG
jgi:acyl-CoA thioesterase-2